MDNIIGGYPGDYLMECQHCGGKFEAQRNTARYCSDKCRQNALREGKRREKQRQALKKVVNAMCDRWCSSFDYDVLRWAYRRIGNYLAYHGQLAESDDKTTDFRVSDSV